MSAREHVCVCVCMCELVYARVRVSVCVTECVHKLVCECGCVFVSDCV